MTFPEKLNVNGFIAHEKGSKMTGESPSEETEVKSDDFCTTDSGSALDDEVCHSVDSVNATNSPENHSNDYQVFL